MIAAAVRNVSLQGILLECYGFSSPAYIEVCVCCIVSRRYYEMEGMITRILDGKIAISFNTPHPSFHQATRQREQMEGIWTMAHPLPLHEGIRTSAGNLR